MLGALTKNKSKGSTNPELFFLSAPKQNMCAVREESVGVACPGRRLGGRTVKNKTLRRFEGKWG